VAILFGSLLINLDMSSVEIVVNSKVDFECVMKSVTFDLVFGILEARVDPTSEKCLFRKLLISFGSS